MRPARTLAKKGNIPVGYYKDEKKTAETFRTINGVRYAIPVTDHSEPMTARFLSVVLRRIRGMRSDTREEISAALDAYHASLSRVLDLKCDALTTPELLACLQRLEVERRRQGAPSTP